MGIMAFFANIFGYILNFLYELIGNFGFAIILFSVLIKLLMLPISWAQQKTMKKSQKVNDEMKQIQFKYKNDQEKMNPASGCLSAIIQIILLLAVFNLVRSPLTYMKKTDPELIKNSIEYVQKQGSTSNYKEIAVINYISNLENSESVSEENSNAENQLENNIEENTNQNSNSEENQTNNENTEQTDKFNILENKDKLYINMNFLGIDLSKVPTEDLKNIKALIIPILYVITSFISIRLSTNMNNKKEKKEKLITDGLDNNENNEQENEEKVPDLNDAMADTNKKMAWFMPVMSISIAMVAPLGLALYWLMNNILMIFERLILNKIVKD